MSGYLHIGLEALVKLLHCKTCQARVSAVMTQYHTPSVTCKRINYGKHTGGGRHIGKCVLTHSLKCAVCKARIDAVTIHGWSPSKASWIKEDSPMFEADLLKSQAKTDGELNPVEPVPQGQKCPTCGKWFTEFPALSRKDNKTEICPSCGTDEALDDPYVVRKRLGI